MKKLLLLVVAITIALVCSSCRRDISVESEDSVSDKSADIIFIQDVNSGGDASSDNQPLYPDTLEVRYKRENSGDPLTEEEITTNTKKILSFLKRIKYFDYVRSRAQQRAGGPCFIYKLP